MKIASWKTDTSELIIFKNAKFLAKSMKIDLDNIITIYKKQRKKSIKKINKR